MGLNIRAIAKICSLVMIFIGGMTILPAIVSIIYRDKFTAGMFVICGFTYVIFGSIIIIFARIKEKVIRTRDGIFAVSAVWFITILLGAITLTVTSAGGISFGDALFESASGYTTTGATVLSDLETLPKGILFYRTLSHWIGGLGIIIIVISVLPMLGSGGYIVADAESSRVIHDKFTPKYTDTARKLFIYYSVMTIACTLLLLPGKMDFFDSITHSMSSVSTGGFSNYDSSIMEIGGIYEYWVLIAFMLFGSINFTLYYYLFSTHWKEFFRDTELRWYTMILVAASIFITITVFNSGTFGSFGESLTQGTFSFVSTISTTGLSSSNYDLWPSFAKMILLVAMLIGGCSTSTAGGLKVYRVAVAIKLIKRNISRRLHPNAHISIKNEEGPVRSDFVSAVAAYIFIYIAVIFVSILLLSIENKSFMETVSAVIACLGNVGPGFGDVGPAGNYDTFSYWGKLVLTFDMIAGRLEILGILLMFSGKFWDTDRFRL